MCLSGSVNHFHTTLTMDQHPSPWPPATAFQRLFDTISTLRGPSGCPWDQRQTMGTLKKYIREESAELLEAMAGKDHSHIKEELGDLFFLLLLAVQINEEQGHFTMEEVLKEIDAKMLRRHPHVFAGETYHSQDELNQRWQAIKSQEKRGKIV